MKKNIHLLLVVLICYCLTIAGTSFTALAADNIEINHASHYNGSANGLGTWGVLGSRVANLKDNYSDPTVLPNTLGGDEEYVIALEHLSNGNGSMYNQSVLTWQTATSPITNYLSGEFETVLELHPTQTTYPITMKFRMANANSGATTADFIGLDVITLGGEDAQIMAGGQATGLYYRENATYTFKVIADTTNDTYSVYLIAGPVASEADGAFEEVGEETLLGTVTGINNGNFGFVRTVDFIVSDLPTDEDMGILAYFKNIDFNILPLRTYLKSEVSEGDSAIPLAVSHWVAAKGSKSDALSGTVLVKKNGISLEEGKDYTVTASYCRRSSLNSWSRNPVIALTQPIAGGDTYEIGFEDVEDIHSRKADGSTVKFTVSAQADDKLGLALETLDTLILNDNTDLDNIISDLSLVKDIDGVEIIWTSSDTDAISTEGSVTRPASFTNSAVTLTAELTYEGKTYTKVLECTVKTTYDPTFIENAKDSLTDEVILGENIALNNITGNLTLPSSMDGGISISWKSSNKNAINTDGTVTRPAGYNDYSVLLTATLTDGIGTYTKTFACVVKTTFDPNRPPMVTDISVKGIERVGNTLKISYTFDDINKLTDNSSIQWEYSSDGTEFSKISGATSKSYDIESDYEGKYIRVAIEPTNSSGNSGETVYSKVIGPVLTKSSVSSQGGGGGGSSSGRGKGSFTGGAVSFAPPAKQEETNSGTADKKYIFRDVSDSHWAAENITKLAVAGIISGDEGGYFRPDDSITREEFVKMVVVALKIDGGNGSFADMDESHWAHKYATAALHSGIVTGYEDGTFRGNQTITREEIAVILNRAVNYRGWKGSIGESISFSDNDNISDYAIDSVSAMSAAGVINGMPDGRFLPGANATRAQAAKMIGEVYANVQ